MKLKEQIRKTDLLIIDADGTLGQNVTVGLANQVALYYLVKIIDRDFKIKKRKILNTRQNLAEIFRSLKRLNPSFRLHDYYMAFKVILAGVMLYAVKGSIDMMFNLGITQNYSNRALIRLYIFVMKGINIDDFLYTANDLKKNAYPGVINLIKKFKKAKKVLITQSFAYSSGKRGLIDQYAKIIKFDDMVLNSFVCEDGKIIGGFVKIEGMDDKTKHTVKMINKYKSKNVAVICNDNADLGTAKLAKLVIARKPPRQLRKETTFAVDDYKKLVRIV